MWRRKAKVVVSLLQGLTASQIVSIRELQPCEGFRPDI